MTTDDLKYGLKDLEKKRGPLTIGRLLRAWRESEEMTQRQFAKKIAYSPKVMVKLALQDELRNAGLKYEVEVRG